MGAAVFTSTLISATFTPLFKKKTQWFDVWRKCGGSSRAEDDCEGIHYTYMNILVVLHIDTISPLNILHICYTLHMCDKYVKILSFICSVNDMLIIVWCVISFLFFLHVNVSWWYIIYTLRTWRTKYILCICFFYFNYVFHMTLNTYCTYI